MIPSQSDLWKPPYRLAEIPGLGDRVALVNSQNAIVATIGRSTLTFAIKGIRAPALSEMPAHMMEMALGQGAWPGGINATD